MLAIILGVLKYLLIALGSGLGIYGTVHDYKVGGRLTREGRFAIWAMLVVGTLTVLAAGLEQVATYHDAQEKLRKDRLGRPLSDLTIEWTISSAETTAFETEMNRDSQSPLRKNTDNWPLWIGTAVRGGEMAIRKTITGWRLDVSLERPEGELFRRFKDDTVEWNAFQGAIQRIIGDHFELALTDGTSVLDLATGPMELEINHSRISFHVLRPHLSPLDIETSEVRFIHTGDFRPAKLRMASTDPRIAMDEDVALTWKGNQSAPTHLKPIIKEQN